MNCIIPFESRVKFNGPVKEICSISLEHEITQNNSEILGNFLISGTYKEHELSINTSDFKFTIPFNVELTTRIESDTLEFSIDNFTYDIEGNDMIVKIDYIVSADDVREDIIEESVLDPFDLISETAENNDDDSFLEDTDLVQEVNNIKPEIRENIAEEIMLGKIKDVSNEEKMPSENIESREEINPEIVSTLETENDYMTYHIHIVKEAETVESIALNYKMTKDDLEKFNDITDLMQGDKLIIPLLDE